MNKKLLIIGDLHLGRMGYSELFEDARISEKKEILNFIVEESLDCETIVFLGDCFNQRNPLSETIKEFTSFLEALGEKDIYIISGNHETKSFGETTQDYLKEISGKKWHIVTNKPQKINDFVFAPYQTKNMLDCKDNKSAVSKIMKNFKNGKILFHHFAMTNSFTSSGQLTDLFDEIVLNTEKLKKHYKLIVGGHVHAPYTDSKQVIVAGSIFTSEVNEHEKFIWKINEDSLKIEQKKLPGRGIYKLQDPKQVDFDKIPNNSIVKIILTDRNINTENIKKWMERFDGHLIIEQYPSVRKKLGYENEDVLNMSVENLLELYSKAKKVSLDKLKAGWEIIKN